MNVAPKSAALKTRSSERSSRSNAPRRRKSSASSPKKRNASRNVPRATKKTPVAVLGEVAATPPHRPPENPQPNPNPTGEMPAKREKLRKPQQQPPPPRRTECGNLRVASARVVTAMLEVQVQVVQETSGAAEVVPMMMVARMMDRGRALELAGIVDRCDVVAMTAKIVVDRCVGEETGMIATIVDRFDVEIGRRCVMATGVAPAVACAAVTEVTAGMVEIDVEVTLDAVETAVGMIVVVRDAMAEIVGIRGVVHRRRTVGEAVVVLELEANPVETGETARRNRLSRGMNRDVAERRGPRKLPVIPVPMRTAGRT